jgi:hypothetical protein
VYQSVLNLEEGRHEIWIEKPTQGRYPPRVIEVDAQGEATEIEANGSKRPIREMTFFVPRPGEAPPEGWISKP